ncbi:MAG: hypothetical protein NTW86_02010 [Candidatus Sumerlaeota bacterium]|nr:hypothetical protein [Candidatus Sumerlaeota bacterium]
MISLLVGFHEDMADPTSDDPVKRQSTRLSVVGSVDGQTTLDLRQVARVINEKTARALGDTAMLKFYGINKGEDVLTAERLFPLYEAASALHLVKAGAPPVFMYYGVPYRPLPETVESECVHNIRFGMALKERMDQLGLECVLRSSKDYQPEDRPAQMNREMVEFFVKRFPQDAK